MMQTYRVILNKPNTADIAFKSEETNLSSLWFCLNRIGSIVCDDIVIPIGSVSHIVKVAGEQYKELKRIVDLRD